MKNKILILILILTIFGCSEATLNDPTVQSSIENIVPFTTQAPFAEWDDDRQQDACEEASALMAMLWAQNKTDISKQDAKEEILNIIKYEDENFGASKDSSAEQTVLRIFNGYFNYNNVETMVIKSYTEIINELDMGHLIVIPTNGKALKNPNFTNGGPDKHMLVIKNYNQDKKQFITNDPGTRNGENYVYSFETIFDSIRNYPTSNLEETLSEKTIIIVSKDPTYHTELQDK